MSTLTATIERAPNVTSGALETLPEMPRNGATCDIDTSVLKRALTRIKPATSTRGNLALAGVRLFCGADGNAYMEATDLVIAGRILLTEAVIARGFDVLLPAREFQRALKDAAKGTRALLTIAAKEREVTLKVGPVSHLLAESSRREDFPTLDLNPPSDVIVQSTGAALGKAVMRAAVFASKDGTRPILTGVYITPRDGGRIVGCDSYRLDVAPLDGVQADVFGEHDGFNVPAAPLMLALKGSSKGSDATGPVTVSITTGGMSSSSSHVSDGRRLAIIDRPGEWWTVWTLDGSYPNYWQLLPEDSARGARFTLPTGAFLATVAGGASVLTGNAPIRLKFSKADPEMHVTGYVPDVTEYQATVAGVDCDHWGYGEKTCEIGMNPVFLRDILALQDGETVAVSVSTPLRSAMFRDGSGAVSLLMPIRLNV